MQNNIMQTIHCKVIRDNEIRRFLLNGTEFTSLKETISKLFSLTPEFVLKYLDDEGEYITIENQDDLSTALLITPNLLKLKVSTGADSPSRHRGWNGKKNHCGGRKMHRHHAGGHKHRSSERKHHSHEDFRKIRAEKKLSILSQYLKDFADDSQLSPEDNKRKQRLLRKISRLEAIVNSDGSYHKRQKTALTPDQEQQNRALRMQLVEIRIQVSKIRERQRELKLLRQNCPGNKEVIDELDQLKERKGQFKAQRKSLCEKMHS
jgi:hypothetical protein